MRYVDGQGPQGAAAHATGTLAPARTRRDRRPGRRGARRGAPARARAPRRQAQQRPARPRRTSASTATWPTSGSRRARPSAGPPTAQLMGTVDYVSPEQIRGEQVDGRADQYGLGLPAVRVPDGDGALPQRSEVAALFAHLEEPRAERRASAAPELPPAIDAVLARGMAKEPEDRFESCDALVAAAREALGLDAPAAGGAVALARRGSRRWLVAIVAAVALGAAARRRRGAAAAPRRRGRSCEIDPAHQRGRRAHRRRGLPGPAGGHPGRHLDGATSAAASFGATSPERRRLERITSNGEPRDLAALGGQGLRRRRRRASSRASSRATTPRPACARTASTCSPAPSPRARAWCGRPGARTCSGSAPTRGRLRKLRRGVPALPDALPRSRTSRVAVPRAGDRRRLAVGARRRARSRGCGASTPAPADPGDDRAAVPAHARVAVAGGRVWITDGAPRRGRCRSTPTRTALLEPVPVGRGRERRRRAAPAACGSRTRSTARSRGWTRARGASSATIDVGGTPRAVGGRRRRGLGDRACVLRTRPGARAGPPRRCGDRAGGCGGRRAAAADRRDRGLRRASTGRSRTPSSPARSCRSSSAAPHAHGSGRATGVHPSRSRGRPAVELVPGCTEVWRVQHARRTEARRLVEREHVDAIVAGGGGRRTRSCCATSRGATRTSSFVAGRPRPARGDAAAAGAQPLPLRAGPRPGRRRARRPTPTATSAGGAPRSCWRTGTPAGAQRDAFAAEFCALGGSVGTSVARRLVRSRRAATCAASRAAWTASPCSRRASSVPTEFLKALARARRRPGARDRGRPRGHRRPGSCVRSVARLAGVVAASYRRARPDCVPTCATYARGFPGTSARVAATELVTGYRDAVEALLRGLERADGDVGAPLRARSSRACASSCSAARCASTRAGRPWCRRSSCASATRRARGARCSTPSARSPASTSRSAGCSPCAHARRRAGRLPPRAAPPPWARASGGGRDRPGEARVLGSRREPAGPQAAPHQERGHAGRRRRARCGCGRAPRAASARSAPPRPRRPPGGLDERRRATARRCTGSACTPSARCTASEALASRRLASRPLGAACWRRRAASRSAGTAREPRAELDGGPVVLGAGERARAPVPSPGAPSPTSTPTSHGASSRRESRRASSSRPVGRVDQQQVGVLLGREPGEVRARGHRGERRAARGHAAAASGPASSRSCAMSAVELLRRWRPRWTPAPARGRARRRAARRARRATGSAAGANAAATTRRGSAALCAGVTRASARGAASTGSWREDRPLELAAARRPGSMPSSSTSVARAARKASSASAWRPQR